MSDKRVLWKRLGDRNGRQNREGILKVSTKGEGEVKTEKLAQNATYF